MATVLIALLILVPWIGALMIWMVGDEMEAAEHNTAILFSIVSTLISLILITQIGEQVTLTIPAGGAFGDFTFVPDGMGVFLAVIANGIGCLAIVFSVDYMHGERDLARYYAIILFFIGTMSGLVLTSNMLLMFFFWEMTALCSYLLISFFNDQEASVRGGLTALFITQFGGLGLMLSCFLVYAATQSLDIFDFIAAAQSGTINPTLLAIAGFGCIFGAAAKSSQFPFHTWLPDAMEAPTPVSALIHAATMVNAGVYLLCRFYPAFEAVPGWKMTIVVIGLITILLTSLMAIFATDIKKVLAFSTVSQLGFLFVAIGAGSVLAAQFHLMSHSIFKALLFLCAGALIHSCGTRDMRKMGGLFSKMPVVGSCFIIGAMALSGIPPMNGFWSKEFLMEAVNANCPHWVYVVMVFAIFLTAFYTTRCTWIVFFGNPRSELQAHDAGKFMRISLILLAFGTCFSWLLFGKFSRILSGIPFQNIETEPLGQMVLHTLGDSLTWIAIAFTALGILLFLVRDSLSAISGAFTGLGKIARKDFGFEDINSGIVRGFHSVSEFCRDQQTGVLNRNIAGVLVGLMIVLAILLAGE